MNASDAPNAASPDHDQAPDRAGRKMARLDRWELIVSIFLTAVSLFLIIARTGNAGPLWRDECDSLQHATMPTLADVFEHRRNTSFPILFPIIVRAYTSLFGTSDAAIRSFGLAVGVLFLAIVWFQARRVEKQAPLILPLLIGVNANFFTTGLWLRGYGLGSVFIVLAFALTAKFLLKPSGRMLLAMLAAYLAAMHCLFFNGVLVPSLILAATIVLLVRREWKWLSLLLGVAVVCGVTYLPYLRQIQSDISKWSMVLDSRTDVGMIIHRFAGACGGSTTMVAAAWLILFSFCVGAGLWRFNAIRKTPSPERDMLLFGLCAIPVSVLTYYKFILLLHNEPLQRHFLALTCVLAAAAALIGANLSSSYRFRIARMALVVAMMVALPFAPWNKLNERTSNIDLIVTNVEKEAKPNDLIVVNPLSVGISFNHYYHGPNRWLTVPNIEDHRVHRYDLLHNKMMEFFPLDDVENAIATTLKSGSRVWIVGTISITSAEREPLVLAPAPDPQFGWESGAYINSWSQQIGEYLRRHARHIDLVVRRQKLVNERENLWLLGCDGWRY